MTSSNLLNSATCNSEAPEETITSTVDNLDSSSTLAGFSGSGKVHNITESTIDAIITANELVFIFFHIDSSVDKGSYNLSIFNKAAQKVKSEFPKTGQIFFGEVDCDREKSLADRFEIFYYPKFCLIRDGQLVKRNFSDNINVESLVEYIKKELDDPIKEFHDINDLGTLDPKKRMYIGYFDSKDVPEYDVFRRAASVYKHYCQFRAGFGKFVAEMHPPGQPVIVMRPDVALSNELDETFGGSSLNYCELKEWMSGNYVPLVRKTGITYENQYDFYIEHLPILVLCHLPGDDEIVKRFTDICKSSFMHLKNEVLFLTSDDKKFSRRLTSLKKQHPDLPSIGYITTEHLIFLFRVQDMEVSGKLQQFVKEHITNTPTDSGEAPNITEETINLILEANEVVLLMFYHYKNRSAFDDIPLLNDAAVKIKEEFPQEGQIAFGKVEVQNEKAIAIRFNIWSYTTFLLIRNGQPMKRKFRGNGTTERLVDYIRKELEDPIKEFKDISDLGTLDPKIRMFIGYFDTKEVPEYDVFRRAASVYKDYCQFRVGFGEVVADMHPPGRPIVALRPDVTLSNDKDEVFSGSLLSYNELNEWMSENYFHLVRKTPITTDNEGDFYDEDIPLLVLFCKPGDEALVKLYTRVCESSFLNMKDKLIITTSHDVRLADGLSYMRNVRPADFPFIAIIASGGMPAFVFGDIEQIEVPGKLEQFVNENINIASIGFGLF